MLEILTIAYDVTVTQACAQKDPHANTTLFPKLSTAQEYDQNAIEGLYLVHLFRYCRVL